MKIGVLSFFLLTIVSVIVGYFFVNKETPEKAVQETVASILNKDYNLFVERVNLPVVTNFIYSEMVMKKTEIQEDSPSNPIENALDKITKKVMIFFAPSNKDEISDLISDYLLRDSIPNSSLFNKEIFFEFLDNIDKSSVSIKLLKRDTDSFRIRLYFYQRIIDQKLSVDLFYQNINGKWTLTEVEGIPRLSLVYSAKRKTLIAQKVVDQQNFMKSYLLVENIQIDSNKDLIGSFFRIRVKIRNIGRHEIYGYGIKVGYYNDAGVLSPFEVITQEGTLSPGDSRVFYLEPKSRLLEFKMASNRGQRIDSEIAYINLENETLKAFIEDK